MLILEQKTKKNEKEEINRKDEYTKLENCTLSKAFFRFIFENVEHCRLPKSFKELNRLLKQLKLATYIKVQFSTKRLKNWVKRDP